MFKVNNKDNRFVSLTSLNGGFSVHFASCVALFLPSPASIYLFKVNSANMEAPEKYMKYIQS